MMKKRMFYTAIITAVMIFGALFTTTAPDAEDRKITIAPKPETKAALEFMLHLGRGETGEFREVKKPENFWHLSREKPPRRGFSHVQDAEDLQPGDTYRVMRCAGGYYTARQIGEVYQENGHRVIDLQVPAEDPDLTAQHYLADFGVEPYKENLWNRCNILEKKSPRKIN